MSTNNNQNTAAGAIPVYLTGGSAAAGVTPVTGGALVSGIVAKAAPGASFGAYAATASGVAACWLVGYNATAVPADGAVNPVLILQAVPVGAGPAYASTTDIIPVGYSAGIVYYLTSGATPYANKSSVQGFISAKVA